MSADFHQQMEHGIPPSNFSTAIAEQNGLLSSGWREWIFLPGTMFRGKKEWWGERKERVRPHEGVDICYYRTNLGAVCRLDEGFSVPAAYDGTVIKICRDFLGETVFMKHGLRGGKGRILISASGHMVPSEKIAPDRFVAAGEIVGRVALPQKKQKVPPHLHFSLGWLEAEGLIHELDWEFVASDPRMSLVDPLILFRGRYSVLSFLDNEKE